MAIKFHQHMLNSFTYFEYEDIEAFRDAVRVISRSKEKSLGEELGMLLAGQSEPEPDSEMYRNHLEDALDFLGDITYLSSELCILALHKKLEITTRKILLRFYPNLKADDLYKIDYLKKHLPFDITALKEYSSADELRCISNAIKHDGRTTKQLAKFPGWIQGQALANLDGAYNRLAPLVKNYITNLCHEVYKDKGLQWT